LRRWKTIRGSKRKELEQLFAVNRRFFKAYLLREQLDKLWTYKTRVGVVNFLLGWFKALRSQRLPEMGALGAFLLRHLDGIAAYCDHPVRFGVVESLNTTIKAIIRRARGMWDEALLLLKLKWATARPIRSAGPPHHSLRNPAASMRKQTLDSGSLLPSFARAPFSVGCPRGQGFAPPRNKHAGLTAPGSRRAPTITSEQAQSERPLPFPLVTAPRSLQSYEKRVPALHSIRRRTCGWRIPN
jgi:transposase